MKRRDKHGHVAATAWPILY